MLSNHIYAAEAELRWLDEVEETVTRAKLQTGKAPKPDVFHHCGQPGTERPVSAHQHTSHAGQAAPILQLRRASRVPRGRSAAGPGPGQTPTWCCARGEFVAVMGPSGSGKSTLLHLAGGLDVPTYGQVLVDGIDLAGLTVTQRTLLRRRAIGYVFQDFNLLPA